MSEEYIPTQQEVDEELHECARYGELDTLKEMKESDDTNMLNFNACDSQGNTALHKAAANNHVDVLQYVQGYIYLIIMYVVFIVLIIIVFSFIDTLYCPIGILLKIMPNTF